MASNNHKGLLVGLSMRELVLSGPCIRRHNTDGRSHPLHLHTYTRGMNAVNEENYSSDCLFATEGCDSVVCRVLVTEQSIERRSLYWCVCVILSTRIEGASVVGY